MTDKRYVGKPDNNPSRMEYRDVPVQKDAPRLNDKRKVRPSAAATPPMGIRPNHPGAQTAPKAPPDKLAGSYIGARDVPIKDIHEGAEVVYEAGDIKIVHNRLLGGHFVVRGAHHSPLSGPHPSRKAAMDHMRQQQADRDAASDNRFQKARTARGVTEEVELNEWPWSRQQEFIPGDAIAYRIGDRGQGIDLYLVHNGNPIAHKQVGSYQDLKYQIDDLQDEITRLKQERRYMSINPKRAAHQAALDFAREQRVRPRKIGMLNREIPIHANVQDMQQQEPDQAQQPGGPAAAPAARQAAPAMPQRQRPSGHRGEPGLRGGPAAWGDRFGARPTPAATPPRAAAATASPATPPASDKPRVRVKQGHHPGTVQQDQMLQALGYSPDDIFGMNREQKEHIIQSRTPKATRARRPASTFEAYPDMNIEHDDDVSHESRISDLSWDGHQRQHGKGPGMPDLNLKFIQARDVNVEKIHERADDDMDALFGRVMARMGISEDEQPVDEATWHQQRRPVSHVHDTHYNVVTDPPGQPASSMLFQHEHDAHAYRERVGQHRPHDARHTYVVNPRNHQQHSVRETAIPRTRARWV